MKPAARKRLACELAIALLTCGAVRYFFIAPAESGAAQLHAEAGQIENRHAAPVDLTAASLQSARHSAEQTINQVRERSRLAENQTELLATLTSLATECGLSLDQFEPGRATGGPEAAVAPPPPELRAPAPPPPSPAPQGPLAPSVIALESRIFVSGPYASVTQFLDLLVAKAGFTIVKSVQLDAGDRPNSVRATILAEHLGFAAPGTTPNPASPRGAP